jgi:hypothetical protein
MRTNLHWRERDEKEAPPICIEFGAVQWRRKGRRVVVVVVVHEAALKGGGT